MLTALALSLTVAATGGPLDWVHDDWAAAKKQALANGQLVAVDVWATWCHTCLSMKNFTLKEKPLGKVAKSLTWLAVDYDLPKNAKFFGQFPVSAFPTFMVIDPKTEAVVDRWIGSGTADQMAAFFASAGSAGDPLFAKGQRALSKKQYDAAATHFVAALPNAKDPAGRTRVLSGLIEALYNGDKVRCAKEGVTYLDQTDNSAPGVDFAIMVGYCAAKLEKAEQKAVHQKVLARLVRASKDTKALAVDDVSSVLGTIAELQKELGDEAAAKQTTATRIATLEAAARQAKSPAERATFDAHRFSSYLATGDHKKAERMLRASEKAFPKDFNHPWRLAVLYRETGDWAQGVAAIDRALANGYGPRRVRLYSTKVDLLLGLKKVDDAERTVAMARKEIAAMDADLVRKYWLDELDGKAKKVAAAKQVN